MNKIYHLKWKDMLLLFIKEYAKRSEWKDVVSVLKKELAINTVWNKTYADVVNKVLEWRPNRKRIIEEDYKIELRSYLEDFYNVEEEKRESLADLVVNGSIPIEVKKDPTLSEYDRLMGQMIRQQSIWLRHLCGYKHFKRGQVQAIQ